MNTLTRLNHCASATRIAWAMAFAANVYVQNVAAALVFDAFSSVTNVSCISPGCSDEDRYVGPTPGEVFSSAGFGAVRQGSAGARANAGFLGVFAYAQAPGRSFPFTGAPIHVRSAASASVTVDDLLVTGPDAGPAVVPTRVTLDFKGVFGFSGATDDEQSASVSIHLRLPGALTDGSGMDFLTGSIRLIQRDGSGVFEIDKRGVLMSVIPGIDPAGDALFNTVARINATVTTPTFFVPVGTPSIIQLQLSTSEQQSTLTGFGKLSGGFEDTLSFTVGGPVFDLPEGYVVNSLGAKIVNNSFVVPVPASLPLFAMAVGWLARRVRMHQTA